MLKTKKILSVVLSFILIFGVLSTAASAAGTVINAAKINVDTNIAGVDADDYESYISILTTGLTFDDADDVAVFVYEKVDGSFEAFYGNFVADKTYSFGVYMRTEAGYTLADETRGYINGKECIISANSEYGIVIYNFEVTVGKSVTFPEPDYEGINKVEVTVDTDIAGMSASNYEEYISINTKGLAFGNAVYVADSNGNKFNGNFKAGETYYLQVILIPEKGYDLATKVDCIVNGEKVNCFVEESWSTDSFEFEHVIFDFEITVDAEEELSFFARIIKFFRDLFAKIFGA